MRYVMVAYHWDLNYIFVEAMKNHSKGQMILTYQSIMRRMAAAGLSVKKHILDNKILAEFKSEIKENQVTYKLVLPGEHRCMSWMWVLCIHKKKAVSVRHLATYVLMYVGRSGIES